MRVTTAVCLALLIAALSVATGCGNGAGTTNTGNAGGENTSSTTGNQNTSTTTTNTGNSDPNEQLANKDGICPVTGQKATGDYVMVHEGRVWSFASEDAMNTFLENPDAYIAMAGGN